MRLIDADELCYTLTEGLRCELCVNQMHTDRGCDGNCMIPNQLLLNALGKYIADGINNQKTVDAVPVVHAKWIPLDEKTAECSSCGDSFSCTSLDMTRTARMHKIVYQFCPHCGAKMDGGSE